MGIHLGKQDATRQILIRRRQVRSYSHLSLRFSNTDRCLRAGAGAASRAVGGGDQLQQSSILEDHLCLRLSKNDCFTGSAVPVQQWHCTLYEDANEMKEDVTIDLPACDD